MLELWVLYTYRVVDGQLVCAAYLYLDEATAQAAGARLAANPALPGLAYMVLPLQGAAS